MIVSMVNVWQMRMTVFAPIVVVLVGMGYPGRQVYLFVGVFVVPLGMAVKVFMGCAVVGVLVQVTIGQ